MRYAGDDLYTVTCAIRIERQWVPGKGGQYLKDVTKTQLGDRTVFLGELGMGLIERYRNVMRTMLTREPRAGC